MQTFLSSAMEVWVVVTVTVVFGGIVAANCGGWVVKQRLAKGRWQAIKRRANVVKYGKPAMVAGRDTCGSPSFLAGKSFNRCWAWAVNCETVEVQKASRMSHFINHA